MDHEQTKSPATTNIALEIVPEQNETPNPIYSTFSKHEKAFIMIMATLATATSPLTSQIYLPAIPTLAHHYGQTISLINLTVTTFMIIQGIAPSFISSFADSGGRRPAYMVAFVIYSAANLGLALQDSYGALMALRCVQSAGSSALFSLGYGVAADIAAPANRGKYMGLMNSGSMTALSIGPLLGGVLDMWLGWRSIFWFLLILSGSYLLIYSIAMPETSRNLVGNGAVVPSPWWRMSVIQYFSANGDRKAESTHIPRDQETSPKPRFRSFNPLNALAVFRNKAASITICSLGIVFALNIIMTTSTANLFGSLYNLDSFKIGLCLLPAGVSGCVGSAVTGIIVDINYRRIARKLGISATRDKQDPNSQAFPFERARLQIVFPLLVLLIACVIPYGWVLAHSVPLYVPLILQGLMGFCGTSCVSILSALLVDLYPSRPATASAAANLVRCWLAAGAVGVLDYMLSAMGWGWCFCFYGLVVLVLMPLLWVEYRYGLSWRSQ